MRDRQAGQVILVLILVMTVALAIGISVIQRSLSDISTSSKIEESSRAFSAAEAGIERTLGAGSTAPFSLQNNSQVTSIDTGLIPAVPAVGTGQDPLEYPLLAKEEVAQVWLANPDSGAQFYKQNSLDVYWGNSSKDPAALEVTLVYYDGTKYVPRKWYLDQSTATRNPINNFTSVVCSGYCYSTDPVTKAGTFNPGQCAQSPGGNFYQCKYTIGGTSDPGGALPSSPSSLMLLRARLLYNVSSQPFAAQAVNKCGADCSLPPQARKITSTGVAGTTQRKVQLFQLNKVVPPYFDYAIFSTGEISK